MRLTLALLCLVAVVFGNHSLFAQSATDYGCATVIGTETTRAKLSAYGSPEKAEKFAAELQKKEPDWHLYLPSCPHSIKDISQSPIKWEKDTNPVLQCFHPGAGSCYRTSDSYQSPNSSEMHGQQCCYTVAGDLITAGRAAGTADYASPNGSDTHVKKDVVPFYFLSLARYQSVWVPNQGEIVMPGGQTTDSGWDFRIGESYMIQAYGNVVWGQNGSNSSPNGSTQPAESVAGLLVAPPPFPQFPTGSLLGFLVYPNGKSSTAWLVGEGGRLTPSVNGRFYLVINDGYISNNKGKFFVNVRKTQKPS